MSRNFDRKTRFGQIISFAEVEQAVIDWLKLWLPSYLTEMELQLELNVGTLVPIATWTTRNRYEDVPANDLPRIIVISGGLIGQPRKDGAGHYNSIWRIGIGLLIAHSDLSVARFLASVYSAAIRGTMERRLDENFMFDRIDWINETPTEPPLSKPTLQYQAVISEFAVTVNNVVQWYAGPDEPDPPHPGPWPDVEEVIIDMQKEAING